MKKNLIRTLIILSCFCNQSLFASGKVDHMQQNETEILEGAQSDTPYQEIGLEELRTTRPLNDSNLQNWLFAAGSIISATVAMLVVGWSQGRHRRIPERVRGDCVNHSLAHSLPSHRRSWSRDAFRAAIRGDGRRAYRPIRHG